MSNGIYKEMSRSQSCSPQHLRMKLTALPVFRILLAKSLFIKLGTIIRLSLYLCNHNFSSGTDGSVSTKNSLNGSLISPSIIQVLIIVKIGADTSFKILLMKEQVPGLPFRVKVLIAEHMAPPLRFLIESIMRASHFMRSRGS